MALAAAMQAKLVSAGDAMPSHTTMTGSMAMYRDTCRELCRISVAAVLLLLAARGVDS
jgi:hypothetical protein